MENGVGTSELVMVSNRLPVDRTVTDDGEVTWKTSPGGLVTAVEPIVRELGCLWVGWSGDAEEEIEPFSVGAMRLIPVPLTNEEISTYYEGFSNDTLWPLYHDVISPPFYHREWWEEYQRINQRFAKRVADEAGLGAIVWVHDYQLQLVPALLREMRPDLTIAFFLHIPFPSSRLFAQLPWRRQIIEGLLGADVIGFQRVQDAESFRFIAERYVNTSLHGNMVIVHEIQDSPSRTVLAQEFPISIDSANFASIAARPEIQARAKHIREELGNPRKILLGVDRLDYTKGIRHRLKAYEELLEESEVSPDEIVLIQVASPSRERVLAYQQLRDEVESTVGRINGTYGSIGCTPVVYLHQGHSQEEMVALYLAADVMVVTALRDGMNLVAKEYVACRFDEEGVLLLSEFAGARDELDEALLVNPHDIEGMKAAFLRAIHMPKSEQRRRMRALRAVVAENDVSHWANNFLSAVTAAADSGISHSEGGSPANSSEAVSPPSVFISNDLEARLRRLATASTLIVASDFDGTLASIVANPQKARMLPRAKQALEVLRDASGVNVAILSGRSLASLESLGVDPHKWVISASHGAEFSHPRTGSDRGATFGSTEPASMSEREAALLHRLTRRLNRVFGDELGVRLEQKPFGVAVHTRQVFDHARAQEILNAAVELAQSLGVEFREGKQVREFSVRKSSKATALEQLRKHHIGAPVLFLGDDQTDEDVFVVLGSDDLGIKVGAGQTHALERIDDPETAAAVLALLAELRTGTVIGSSQ